MIKGLTRLTKIVHNYDARIFVQLNHTGRYAPGAIIGTNPLTPSVTEEPHGMYPPKEMTQTDIKDIIQAFGDAAERARESGFDGIQIHAAHGYLISQFLSPHTNKRTDNWGGSTEKRAQFLLAIYQEIRTRLGNDFPVWVKINCKDFVEDGLSLKDSLLTTVLLEKEGINAIEISGGITFNTVIQQGVGDKEPEAYFLPQAEELRARLKLPLIMVGGIRSIQTIEMLIKDKGVNLIAMCRPFIHEPNFALKLRKKAKIKSTCISCNTCIMAKKNEPIRCQVEKNIKSTI